MTAKPDCELCKGKGWFYGGERGEAREDCPDCRPNPAAKFAPFHKIVAGLLEVKKLIANLDVWSRN